MSPSPTPSGWFPVQNVMPPSDATSTKRPYTRALRAVHGATTTTHGQRDEQGTQETTPRQHSHGSRKRQEEQQGRTGQHPHARQRAAPRAPHARVPCSSARPRSPAQGRCRAFHSRTYGGHPHEQQGRSPPCRGRRSRSSAPPRGRRSRPRSARPGPRGRPARDTPRAAPVRRRSSAAVSALGRKRPGAPSTPARAGQTRMIPAGNSVHTARARSAHPARRPVRPAARR